MAKLNEKERDGLTRAQFAFEKQRKEPLENESHIRNAVARFNQVEGVTDAERDDAWKHIQAAAKKFNVALHETGWREIGGKKRLKECRVHCDPALGAHFSCHSTIL